MISLAIGVTFLGQQFVPSPVFAASATGNDLSVHEAMAASHIPNEFGKVEEVILQDNDAPFLVHIQSAHGNYEAQKNIQSLLHYLHNTQDIDLLLLEGGITEIDPQYLNLFPHNQALNKEIGNYLAKRAELTGPELFLTDLMADGKSMNAHGIEKVEAYRENREAFQNVLRAKEKTEGFLNDMSMQVDSLTAPHLNSNLRSFIRQLENFESKKIDLITWLNYLKNETAKHLGLDLEDAYYQRDWPMLVRLYRIQSLESALNKKEAANEARDFFRELRSLRISKDLIQDMRTIIDFPNGKVDLTSHKLPYRDIREAFEKLMGELPANYTFEKYPHLRDHLHYMILESEIIPKRLFDELNSLQDKLAAELTRNETEAKILRLFKDQRLLKKLFALELTRDDFSRILAGGIALKPSAVAFRFQHLNDERRVRHVKFEHLEELDELFDLSLAFYRGAHEREDFMVENIIAKMKDLKKRKAVLVTGGFHTESLKAFFEDKGFSYLLLSPRITQVPDMKVYKQAMLEANPGVFVGQIENVLKQQPLQSLIDSGISENYLRDQIAAALRDLEVDAVQLAASNIELFLEQYRIKVSVLGVDDQNIPPIVNLSFPPLNQYGIGRRIRVGARAADIPAGLAERTVIQPTPAREELRAVDLPVKHDFAEEAEEVKQWFRNLASESAELEGLAVFVNDLESVDISFGRRGLDTVVAVRNNQGQITGLSINPQLARLTRTYPKLRPYAQAEIVKLAARERTLKENPQLIELAASTFEDLNRLRTEQAGGAEGLRGIAPLRIVENSPEHIVARHFLAAYTEIEVLAVQAQLAYWDTHGLSDVAELGSDLSAEEGVDLFIRIDDSASLRGDVLPDEISRQYPFSHFLLAAIVLPVYDLVDPIKEIETHALHAKLTLLENLYDRFAFPEPVQAIVRPLLDLEIIADQEHSRTHSFTQRGDNFLAFLTDAEFLKATAASLPKIAERPESELTSTVRRVIRDLIQSPAGVPAELLEPVHFTVDERGPRLANSLEIAADLDIVFSLVEDSRTVEVVFERFPPVDAINELNHPTLAQAAIGVGPLRFNPVQPVRPIALQINADLARLATVNNTLQQFVQAELIEQIARIHAAAVQPSLVRVQQEGLHRIDTFIQGKTVINDEPDVLGAPILADDVITLKRNPDLHRVLRFVLANQAQLDIQGIKAKLLFLQDRDLIDLLEDAREQAAESAPDLGSFFLDGIEGLTKIFTDPADDRSQEASAIDIALKFRGGQSRSREFEQLISAFYDLEGEIAQVDLDAPNFQFLENPDLIRRNIIRFQSGDTALLTTDLPELIRPELRFDKTAAEQEVKEWIGLLLQDTAGLPDEVVDQIRGESDALITFNGKDPFRTITASLGADGSITGLVINPRLIAITQADPRLRPYAQAHLLREASRAFVFKQGGPGLSRAHQELKQRLLSRFATTAPVFTDDDIETPEFIAAQQLIALDTHRNFLEVNIVIDYFRQRELDQTPDLEQVRAVDSTGEQGLIDFFRTQVFEYFTERIGLGERAIKRIHLDRKFRQKDPDSFRNPVFQPYFAFETQKENERNAREDNPGFFDLPLPERDQAFLAFITDPEFYELTTDSIVRLELREDEQTDITGEINVRDILPALLGQSPVTMGDTLAQSIGLTGRAPTVNRDDIVAATTAPPGFEPIGLPLNRTAGDITAPGLIDFQGRLATLPSDSFADIQELTDTLTDLGIPAEEILQTIRGLPAFPENGIILLSIGQPGPNGEIETLAITVTSRIETPDAPLTTEILRTLPQAATLLISGLQSPAAQIHIIETPAVIQTGFVPGQPGLIAVQTVEEPAQVFDLFGRPAGSAQELIAVQEVQALLDSGAQPTSTPNVFTLTETTAQASTLTVFEITQTGTLETVQAVQANERIVIEGPVDVIRTPDNQLITVFGTLEGPLVVQTGPEQAEPVIALRNIVSGQTDTVQIPDLPQTIQVTQNRLFAIIDTGQAQLSVIDLIQRIPVLPGNQAPVITSPDGGITVENQVQRGIVIISGPEIPEQTINIDTQQLPVLDINVINEGVLLIVQPGPVPQLLFIPAEVLRTQDQPAAPVALDITNIGNQPAQSVRFAGPGSPIIEILSVRDEITTVTIRDGAVSRIELPDDARLTSNPDFVVRTIQEPVDSDIQTRLELINIASGETLTVQTLRSQGSFISDIIEITPLSTEIPEPVIIFQSGNLPAGQQQITIARVNDLSRQIPILPTLPQQNTITLQSIFINGDLADITIHETLGSTTFETVFTVSLSTLEQVESASRIITPGPEVLEDTDLNRITVTDRLPDGTLVTVILDSSRGTARLEIEDIVPVQPHATTPPPLTGVSLEGTAPLRTLIGSREVTGAPIPDLRPTAGKPVFFRIDDDEKPVLTVFEAQDSGDTLQHQVLAPGEAVDISQFFDASVTRQNELVAVFGFTQELPSAAPDTPPVRQNIIAAQNLNTGETLRLPDLGLPANIVFSANGDFAIVTTTTGQTQVLDLNRLELLNPVRDQPEIVSLDGRVTLSPDLPAGTLQFRSETSGLTRTIQLPPDLGPFVDLQVTNSGTFFVSVGQETPAVFFLSNNNIFDQTAPAIPQRVDLPSSINPASIQGITFSIPGQPIADIRTVDGLTSVDLLNNTVVTELLDQPRQPAPEPLTPRPELQDSFTRLPPGPAPVQTLPVTLDGLSAHVDHFLDRRPDSVRQTLVLRLQDSSTVTLFDQTVPTRLPALFEPFQSLDLNQTGQLPVLDITTPAGETITLPLSIPLPVGTTPAFIDFRFVESPSQARNILDLRLPSGDIINLLDEVTAPDLRQPFQRLDIVDRDGTPVLLITRADNTRLELPVDIPSVQDTVINRINDRLSRPQFPDTFPAPTFDLPSLVFLDIFPVTDLFPALDGLAEDFLTVRQELRVVKEITHGIFGLQGTPFGLGFALHFADRLIDDDARGLNLARLFEQEFLEPVQTEFPEVREDELRALIENSTKVNQEFGVLTVPVSEEVTADYEGIGAVLADLAPLIKAHEKKPIVLVHPGEFSDEFAEQIYHEYHNRVFLFSGDYEYVLSALYSDYLGALGKENQKMAKLLQTRASQLYGKPVSINDLKDSSVVVSNDADMFLQGHFSNIAKQFVHSLRAISAEDRLVAQLLFLLPVSHLENAELLREQPDEFTVRSGNQGNIHFSFNSAFAGKIRILAKAARRLLGSA